MKKQNKTNRNKNAKAEQKAKAKNITKQNKQTKNLDLNFLQIQNQLLTAASILACQMKNVGT